MNEFIALAARQLRTTEGTARSATRALLCFIERQLSHDDFSHLTDRLPGAGELVRQASRPAASAGGFGGLLGGMASRMAATGAVDLGATTALATQLQESGLKLKQTRAFVSLFVGFVSVEIGSDSADGLLGKLPEFRRLVA